MRWHWQNLNEKPGNRIGNALRHGRAWFNAGKNDKYTLHIEWGCLRKSCRAQLSWNGFHDEYAWNCSLAFPPFSLFIAISSPLLWKCSPKKDREIGIAIYAWSLWWNFFTSAMEWDSITPRWRNGSFNLLDFLLGRSKYGKRELEVVDTVIPMPERSYRCTVTMHEDSWRRSRWFTRYLTRATIEMHDGEQIPVPGKGENAWDCDEDATYSLTCCANNVPEAIGEMVATCMRTRQRYGSLDYIPESLK